MLQVMDVKFPRRDLRPSWALSVPPQQSCVHLPMAPRRHGKQLHTPAHYMASCPHSDGAHFTMRLQNTFTPKEPRAHCHFPLPQPVTSPPTHSLPGFPYPAVHVSGTIRNLWLILSRSSSMG